MSETRASSTVWLVGMMGSGKSTVGRALAQRLSRPFVDTDAEIERDSGCSVSEIFAREGEDAFRRRERAAIERWCGAAAVVALGGGAIAQPGIASRLADSGTVVYLRATPETLLSRIGEDEERPLLAGCEAPERLARLVGLLETRREAYETASIAIDTDALSPRDVADRLAARLAPRASG